MRPPHVLAARLCAAAFLATASAAAADPAPPPRERRLHVGRTDLHVGRQSLEDPDQGGTVRLT
jgi:hypothetical protein